MPSPSRLDPKRVDSWGVGSSAQREVREAERWLEAKVSEVIGAMPVVWLEVDDEPSSESMRGVVERNAIALLSNYELEEAIDPPSEGWLRRFSGRPRVVRSGLWNTTMSTRLMILRALTCCATWLASSALCLPLAFP